MSDQLPQATIEERHCRLLALVNEIAAEKLQRLVGQRVEVLAQGSSRKNAARLEGRTRCNKIAVFEGADRHRGQLLDLWIRKCSTFTLYGELTTINLD